jgi:hypothetical protein
MRYTCAVSKDRAGSAPAAASAYFTDSSYVRTILQLVNKQMGLTPRGLPIPYNRTPARPRSPTSFDLSNALCNNPAWRKLLRGSPCLLSTANSQESVASQGIDSRNLTKCSTWHLECRNPFRDSAGCTIVMQSQRRLKSHFLMAKRLPCNPAKARFTFSASSFRRSTTSLQSQTEELAPSRKKSLSCRAQRIGELHPASG